MEALCFGSESGLFGNNEEAALNKEAIKLLSLRRRQTGPPTVRF